MIPNFFLTGCNCQVGFELQRSLRLAKLSPSTVRDTTAAHSSFITQQTMSPTAQKMVCMWNLIPAIRSASTAAHSSRASTRGPPTGLFRAIHNFLIHIVEIPPFFDVLPQEVIKFFIVWLIKCMKFFESFNVMC
jgi:hypothetical protein